MPKKYKRQARRETAGITTTSTSPAAYNIPSTRTSDFNPDYTYVTRDLRRIGILAGSFFAILIVLSFIIH